MEQRRGSLELYPSEPPPSSRERRLEQIRNTVTRAWEQSEARVRELERGLPTYIALLNRHLAECPIDAAVCSSCAHVKTLLIEAEKLKSSSQA